MNPWPFTQLRRLVDCIDGQRVPLNSEERSEMQGEVPYWGANGVVDKIDQYLFDEMLVLLGEDGAPFDDPSRDVAFLVSGKNWVNNHIHVLRPRPIIDPRFLVYALNSTDWRPLISGSTRDKLTQDAMSSAQVPIPNLQVQRAIADFLDAETTRIDALIAKKRNIASLLEARFQLEIDHAIDSISSTEAALGRFVLDLSQGSSLQAAGRPAEPDEWGVLKLNAVKFGRFDPKENKALDEQPNDLPLVPRAGDLLVTRSNTPAYVGDVAAVTRTSPRRMLPDLIYRLRLDDSRISAEFAAYALLTSRSRHEISSVARGSSQSMVKLRGEDIRSLPVPVATPGVQEQVVASLEVRRHQNSEILGKLGKQIELLTEHRQALITAAVTGQIEVLGATKDRGSV